jgi:methionyl-tRNA formyltransferase
MSIGPLRIVFAGTPEFAASYLKALIDSKHQLTGVYTQPDRPAGRGKKIQASSVKQLAESAEIPVFQPLSLKSESEQIALAGLEADVLVVVAYGLILPQAILDTPKYGCLNVHASLLPRWRGAAPIQRAIEAGDELAGVTIMQMDAGLDTGAMLATKTCPIEDHTGASLHNKLAELGPPILLDVLDRLENYQHLAQAQNDEGANYAAKITKAEAQIDWHQSAVVLDRKIRAFNAFPVCFSELGGKRVRLWSASVLNLDACTEPAGTITRANAQGIAVCCGEGQILIHSLQLPGGKMLGADQILNAHKERFMPGARFCTQSLTE